MYERIYSLIISIRYGGQPLIISAHYIYTVVTPSVYILGVLAPKRNFRF